MKSIKISILLLSLAISCTLCSQEKTFTRQDSLRGSITTERAWWDLTYYHLDIKVNPEEQYIGGANMVQYKVLKPAQVMQIDLQPPMSISKVEQDGKELRTIQDI